MILLDTSPLVALCDSRDSLHAAAIGHLDRFRRQVLVVGQPILTEACFHLPHGIQRERLRRFLAAFRVVAVPVVDSSELWEHVFGWLAKYGEHSPDWADAWLAVVSGHERRARVWTYDSEFRSTLRRSDGTRIPLAVT